MSPSSSFLAHKFRTDSRVTFEPSPPKADKSRIQLGANAARGINPLGLERLLDACKLNNSALWCVSQTFFRAGVLVPRTKLTTAAIEARIETISHLYPVNDKVRALGIVAHEKENKNLRGFHILGDDHDIAKLWAALYLHEEGVKGWDVQYRAMCWTASAPGTVYVPYIDLDERGLENDFDRVWVTRVVPTTKAIQKAFENITTTQRPLIFFNYRQDDLLWKYSFHIHWPGFGVENIMQWKEFVLLIEDLPRKLIWTKKGDSWQVKTDEKNSIIDPAVYGGRRQLFRGPFCGKNDLPGAVMLPCCVRQNPETLKHEFVKGDFDKVAIIKAVLGARIVRWPSEVTLLVFKSQKVFGAIRTEEFNPDSPSVSLSSAETSSPLFDFIMPIFLATILPRWQQRRKNILLSLCAQGAVVPIFPLKIIKNEPGNKPGVRFLKIEGDSFCEFDENHVHTQNMNSVGINVDFASCTIRQSCFACGVGRRPAYPFLHSNNRIEIADEKDSKFTAVSFFGKCECAHQLLLDYFSDFFVLQRITRTIWVYDRVHCVWRNDAPGNTIVGQLIDEINDKHALYLKAYKQIVVDRQIQAFNRANVEATQEQAEKFVVKIYEAARVFMTKNTPLVSIAVASRGKILEELRSFTVHHEVTEMNKIPNLIPMKNKKCVNVFTGEVKDMEAHHFFTSCVDAEMINDNEEIQTINEWFKEISTGDTKKAEYIKRICGYSFTFLVHDRKLYVLWGNGQNGKGMVKQFIMDINDGPEGFDSRSKNLLQNFWSYRGNASQSPENATPESHQLLNKTFFYTDDLAPVPLDTNKVKRIAASERQSGRGLYGAPVDILPKGKIWWTVNFGPNAPGDDNAYWERAVYIKMLAKYLEEGLPVDHLAFRFRKNHARYKELLEMKDAFFTICVRELIAYYQSLPWNSARKEPEVLGSFPLPDSVKKTMLEERANKLPLAKFINDYTTPAIHLLQYVKVEELFRNYLIYLENINESRLKRETTESSFIQLMATALDIHVALGVFEGKRLTRQVLLVRKNDHDSYGQPPITPARGLEEMPFIDRAMGASVSYDEAANIAMDAYDKSCEEKTRGTSTSYNPTTHASMSPRWFAE